MPNTLDNTASVIDQQTMKVIDTFPVGREPQHVVPAYDLKTLYVARITCQPGWPRRGQPDPLNPVTGTPGRPLLSTTRTTCTSRRTAGSHVLRTIPLPRRGDGMPQDVKLSPDGKTFSLTR